VLGTSRTEAIRLARTFADTVIVDNLLQTRPQRLSRSLLVLDAAQPWGAGHCPPAGDLRASPDRLLEASDAVLLCEDPAVPRAPELAGRTYGGPVFRAWSELRGAIAPGGNRLENTELAKLRLGLLLAIARPERVERALRVRGIVPATVKFFPDHWVPTPRSRNPSGEAQGARARLDAWLTTSKCATKLGDCFEGAPVWVLDHRLSLPAALIDLCATN
jgi:tetraacyldisaccharide 4'-kinase